MVKTEVFERFLRWWMAGVLCPASDVLADDEISIDVFKSELPPIIDGDVNSVYAPFDSKFHSLAANPTLSPLFERYSSVLGQHNNDNIQIIIEGNENSPEEQLRFVQLHLGVAVPDKVYVGQSFVVMVSVCLPDSPDKVALENAKRVLTILEAQAAGHTSLTMPASLQIQLEDKRREVVKLEANIKAPWSRPFVDLRMQVYAPECERDECNSQFFRLHAKGNPYTFCFHLIPKRQGEIGISVVIYQQQFTVGTSFVFTNACEQIMGGIQEETITRTSVNLYPQNEKISA